MKFSKISQITGIEHTRDLPIELSTFLEGTAKWNSGTHIQHAFPDLNAGDREFIMTGITPEEWEKYMKDPEAELPNDGEDHTSYIVEEHLDNPADYVGL